MGEPKRPIQIRALPRGDEKKTAKSAAGTVTLVSSEPAPKLGLTPYRTHIVVGGAILLAFAVLFSDSENPPPVKPTPGQEAIDPNELPEARVTRYLHETAMKRQLEMQKRALENQALTKPIPGDARIIENDNRNLGVNLEGENAAEKVYGDLYGNNRGTGATPVLPEDKINFRLAERKWITEEEKMARKHFVQNFIKQAYDAGWSIDLDENLVVVRVRPVTGKPRQPLEKVLENLSRQGY